MLGVTQSGWSWRWRDINGLTTTRIRCSSSCTSCTACSWRYCKPEYSERRRPASYLRWGNVRRPRSAILGITCREASPTHPADQIRGWGDVPTRKRPSHMAGRQPTAESGRTGVHSPGRLHQQMSVPGPVRGGHHSGSEGQAHFHKAGGSLAPPTALAAVQLNTVGPPAASKSGAAAAQAKTGAGGTADSARRAAVTEREVPRQRGSEAIGGSVHKGFLCGPGEPEEARRTGWPTRRTSQRMQYGAVGRRCLPRR